MPMIDSNIPRCTSAALLCVALVACSHRPAATKVAETGPEILGVAAAHEACSNYDEVMNGAPYPRDAIIRGIDSGRATVRFDVDGTRVRALSVTSSDPAFGGTAFDLVKKLQCRTDRPTTFEIPLSWRTQR
jgi:outer membrane biosynthesis protein TonB